MRANLRLSIVASFNESMVRLAEHVRRLGWAVGTSNSDELTHAAQNAAAVWHSGRSACRRLAVEYPGDSSVDDARDHLWERYTTLLEMLVQAMSVVPRSSHAELRRLRQQLIKEMSRPLVDGDAPGRLHVETALATP